MKPGSQSGKEPSGQDVPAGGGVALLGRLMWMIIGPICSVFIIHRIIQSGEWLTPLDAVFGLVVLLMLLGRWIEQRSGAAMTAMGEPAGENHLRRYVQVLLPLAIGVWLAANVVGIHFLA